MLRIAISIKAKSRYLTTISPCLIGNKVKASDGGSADNNKGECFSFVCLSARAADTEKIDSYLYPCIIVRINSICKLRTVLPSHDATRALFDDRLDLGCRQKYGLSI